LDDILEICIDTMQKFDGIEIVSSRIVHEYVVIDFMIQDMNFTILTSSSNDSTSMPFITAVDVAQSLPHFLLNELIVGDKTFKRICLYESEHYIAHLFTVEDKIEFCISQLFRLLNLTTSEIEREYQKEFLYYWNSRVKNNCRYDVYLEDECPFGLLEIYKAKDEHMIMLHPNIVINEQYKNKWVAVKDKAAIFLKIEDISEIIPPHSKNTWGIENILDIVDNKQLRRISYEAYKYITGESYYHKSVILVFKLNELIFGCEIRFKNKGVAKLMDKLRNNCDELVFLDIDRCDYHHLNCQIGNDTSLAKKKVAIIGAGSLGSYIASEIVKAGVKKLLLVDGDKLEVDNILRHRSDFWGVGHPKSILIAVDLERFHPEIRIDFKNKWLDSDNVNEVLTDEIDVVIFAGIGSDAQISCNKALTDARYAKPVLYSWLEGDGRHGHALGVNYSNEGCFECLFVDDKGNSAPNKLNHSSEDDVTIIRNGCGGVRVAYGNTILLKTTALVLEVFKHVVSNNFTENFAFSVTDNTFSTIQNPFYERNCGCCNDSD